MVRWATTRALLPAEGIGTVQTDESLLEFGIAIESDT
jgi:hypothetical protein